MSSDRLPDPDVARAAEPVRAPDARRASDGKRASSTPAREVPPGQEEHRPTSGGPCASSPASGDRGDVGRLRVLRRADLDRRPGDAAADHPRADQRRHRPGLGRPAVVEHRLGVKSGRRPGRRPAPQRRQGRRQLPPRVRSRAIELRGPRTAPARRSLCDARAPTPIAVQRRSPPDARDAGRRWTLVAASRSPRLPGPGATYRRPCLPRRPGLGRSAWCSGSSRRCAIFGNFVRFFQEYLSDKAAILAVNDIRRQLYDHVLHIPLGHFGSKGTSDVTSRLVQDAPPPWRRASRPSWARASRSRSRPRWLRPGAADQLAADAVHHRGLRAADGA